MEPLITNRTRLVETYRSYSHAISAEILKKLPPSVDRDDVIGAAELGLVDAARNYDPSRGVLFKTFAYYRIRGSIYDALRKMGWLKGDSKVRFEAAANEYLKDYSEAGTSDAAPASALYEEVQQLTSAVLSSYLLSIEGAGLEISDPQHRSAEDASIANEDRERLQRAVAELPENNRLLIQEYYFQDATLEEIGSRLGLSKSWVCRLHAKTLELLREIMNRPPGTKPRKNVYPVATPTAAGR